MLRAIAILYVSLFCLAAFIGAGYIQPKASGGANGTIKYVPKCEWLVKQIFGVTNGNGRYVPDYKTFVHVQDEINRCNEQNGGLK